MFEHILLAVDIDDDEPDGKLTDAAVQACQHYGATLHVLTIVPSVGSRLAASFFPDNFEDSILEATREKLHQYTETLPDDVPIQHIVSSGTIYERILSVADQVSADMIFVGSHRPELSDYLIGPNAARIVRHAKCSVTVIR